MGCVNQPQKRGCMCAFTILHSQGPFLFHACWKMRKISAAKTWSLKSFASQNMEERLWTNLCASTQIFPRSFRDLLYRRTTSHDLQPKNLTDIGKRSGNEAIKVLYIGDVFHGDFGDLKVPEMQLLGLNALHYMCSRWCFNIYIYIQYVFRMYNAISL